MVPCSLQLHIMTPCGKATDEDMRVRPNRSLVHFHNCTNAHTTPAPLITAGSKWSSPLVLGGVGFKSLVMKGAITAGSQPGSVDPVTKQKKNCPRRCFASPRRCAACSTPTAACSHAEEEGRRGCGGEGPCAVRCGRGRGRTNPSAEHPRAELHAGPRPPARGSGRRRSSTRAPASSSRGRAPAVARSRAPAVGRRPTVGRRPAVELPRSSRGGPASSSPGGGRAPTDACGRAPAELPWWPVSSRAPAVGRRPELDFREVEPARGAPADPAIPTTTESATNRGEIYEKYTS